MGLFDTGVVLDSIFPSSQSYPHTDVSTIIKFLQPCYSSNVLQGIISWIFHNHLILNEPNLNSSTENCSSSFFLVFVNSTIIHTVVQAGNLQMTLNYIFSLHSLLNLLDHIVMPVVHSKYYVACHSTIAMMFKLCNGETLSCALSSELGQRGLSNGQVFT